MLIDLNVTEIRALRTLLSKVTTAVDGQRTPPPPTTPFRKTLASKYRGVGYRPDRDKYMAKITVGAKTIHLGVYDNEVDAAMAFNRAALHYRGPDARLNDIPATQD